MLYTLCVYSAVHRARPGKGCSPALHRHRLYSCTAAGLGPAPRVISYVNGNTSRRRRHWRTTSHIICIFYKLYSESATGQNAGAKVFTRMAVMSTGKTKAYTLYNMCVCVCVCTSYKPGGLSTDFSCKTIHQSFCRSTYIYIYVYNTMNFIWY